MATQTLFEYEGVKVDLRGDVTTGHVIFSGGGLSPTTEDFTYVLWPGSKQWQDISNDVLESGDLEVWKENARQYIRDRRTEAEDLKATQ